MAQGPRRTSNTALWLHGVYTGHTKLMPKHAAQKQRYLYRSEGTSYGVIGQPSNVARLTSMLLGNPNMRFTPGHGSTGGGHRQPGSSI